MENPPPDCFRIAHLSDIHFGRIAHPEIVARIVAEVNASGAGLVAVSGDLTQRARRHEFRAARAMLDAFDAPVLVVPGNHDVRAWWHHPLERVARPDRRFRRFIEPQRTPTFTDSAGRVAAVGIDTAHGLTVKGGLVRPDQLRAVDGFFARAPAGALRVLVMHHHLARLEALGGHDVARGASQARESVHRAGVDLVLCGHLHRSHTVEVEVEGGHRLVVASAGTATSSRGRADDAGANLYHWIDVEAGRFTVRERRFDTGVGAFVADRATAFERRAA